METTFDFSTSLVLVVGFAWLILPGLAVVAIRAALREARVAADLARATTRKFHGRAGPAVLHGRVALADPDESPVEVVVTQTGTETPSRSDPRVAWEETGRRVRFEAFDVVLPDDRRVHVEPDDDARFADPLSDVRVVGPGRREKRAALHDGQEVWVVGAMRPSRGGGRSVDSAYRGSVASSPDAAPAKRLVMRSGRHEPLVVSSARPGGDRTRLRRMHTAAAIVFAAGALWMNAGILRDFYRLAASGHAVQGTVVEPILERRWVSTSRGGGYTDTHYRFRVDYPDSSGAHQNAVLDVDSDAYANYKAKALRSDGSATAVPYSVELVVTDGEHPLVQLGTRPRASSRVLVVGGWALALAFLYAWAGRALRPWYERARLNESEPGSLPLFEPGWRPQTITAPSRRVVRPIVEPSLAPIEAAREIEAERDLASESEHVVEARAKPGPTEHLR